MLDRNYALQQLEATGQWDIIIVGGGCTGLGIALDAASRGYKTLLLEAYDFSKGTSSRSTKLVHGGVRYLAQGNIRLVYDALRERGIMLKNAPHLAKRQKFIIPCFTIWEKLKYISGLKIYDWLSGNWSLGKSRLLTASTTSDLLPSLKRDGLLGGVQYYDGRFDDARMAVALAQTCSYYGGVLLNYCPVIKLNKINGKISGVIAMDVEDQRKYHLKAKAVVNATGIFADDILKMDNPFHHPILKPSQGVHLVFRNALFNLKAALMIPKTTDGRVLFIIPWGDYVIAGTTDTELDTKSVEPRASSGEIDFILENIQAYCSRPVSLSDVVSNFSGLRPLVRRSAANTKTKDISREHKIVVASSGLVTITGGKWTTYRKMAEKTVDKTIEVGGLSKRRCRTGDLKIHGHTHGDNNDHYSIYGSDATLIKLLAEEDSSLKQRLIPSLPFTRAEVIWFVRNEMARTVEDVLARRFRILFFDAKAAIEAAPIVADLMAEEMRMDQEWKTNQLIEFFKLSQKYLPRPFILEKS